MLSRKYQVMILSLFFAVVVVSPGYAQDKVVVVPLNSSAPAVAAWAGGEQDMVLSSEDQIVRTITLDLPSKGLVMVNASGYCDFYSTADTSPVCRCSISQGSTLEFSSLIIAGSDHLKDVSDFIPFGATKAFPLNAGTQTFNLVCDSVATDNLVGVGDTQINAVFHSMPSITVPQAPVSLDAKDAASCIDKFDPTKCN